MAEIIIQKRVNLDFLGEEYKQSYLLLRAIPFKDYENLQSSAKDLVEDDSRSFNFVKEQVCSRFLGGKIYTGAVETDITADNLLDLPVDVFLEAFQQLTGQASPKA